MHNLNDPAIPETLNPEPHDRIAGNWTDDDPQAIDAYFEAMDLGPVPFDSVLEKTDPSAPIVTRLLTKSFALASPDGVVSPDPVMVFPADPNRKSVRLLVAVAGAATGVRIGSAKSDVYGSPKLPATANGNAYDFDAHTGPLWVYNDSTASADIVTVSLWAVTV